MMIVNKILTELEDLNQGITYPTPKKSLVLDVDLFSDPSFAFSQRQS